jgi:hypothetical protein
METSHSLWLIHALCDSTLSRRGHLLILVLTHHYCQKCPEFLIKYGIRLIILGFSFEGVFFAQSFCHNMLENLGHQSCGLQALVFMDKICWRTTVFTGNTTLLLPTQARGSRCWTNPIMSSGEVVYTFRIEPMRLCSFTSYQDSYTGSVLSL